jgi:hypothetical protein
VLHSPTTVQPDDPGELEGLPIQGPEARLKSRNCLSKVFEARVESQVGEIGFGRTQDLDNLAFNAGVRERQTTNDVALGSSRAVTADPHGGYAEAVALCIDLLAQSVDFMEEDIHLLVGSHRSAE